ncbi:MAG: DNA recombination protein RmuC [Bacteroidota bacterium]
MTLLLGGGIGLVLGILGMGMWYMRAKQGLQQQLFHVQAELKQGTEKWKETETRLGQLKVEKIDLQSDILDLNKDLSRIGTERDHIQQQLTEVQSNQAQQRDQLQADFAQLAAKVLTQNSQQLSIKHEDTLRHVLTPLKERIEAFEKRVADSYQQEARERFSLQQEIKKLTELNVQMGEEARNLTQALKGDSKMQGNWGEMVLARVLENSGLREGEEFLLQSKGLLLEDTAGRRLQPDVIVQLPDGKHLIIDSKVSLTAYERFVSASDEQMQESALSNHLNSILTHIRQLSDKHYASLKGVNSPDFVLMFMPVEPAFSLALQRKHDLFTIAWEKRIVLVSPTTLLATLKTVASIWKFEHQNRHAQEIARQGGALYDKFVGFVDEVDNIGKHLQRADQAFIQAKNKLQLGKGSLTSRAERLKELGIKHSKELK